MKRAGCVVSFTLSLRNFFHIFSVSFFEIIFFSFNFKFCDVDCEHMLIVCNLLNMAWLSNHSMPPVQRCNLTF